jgi:hypothetical protein
MQIWEIIVTGEVNSVMMGACFTKLQLGEWVSCHGIDKREKCIAVQKETQRDYRFCTRQVLPVDCVTQNQHSSVSDRVFTVVPARSHLIELLASRHCVSMPWERWLNPVSLTCDARGRRGVWKNIPFIESRQYSRF